MDILRNIELETRLLNELKELFHFAPPGKLRRTLEDLFFMYLTENEGINLPNQRKMFEHIYCLINFLNEAEEWHEQGQTEHKGKRGEP